MKPKRIILVRHGLSQSNAEGFAANNTVPNYLVDLAPKGQLEAKKVGQELKLLIGNESVFFYVSPFLRAKNTFLLIKKSFDDDLLDYTEEVLIREKEQGFFENFQDYKNDLKNKKNYGDFYYRSLHAESTADLYLRINIFFTKLFKKFEDPLFQDNVVIVCHSLVMRVFLMRWFHLTVEQFDSLQRPKNCSKLIFELDSSNKYELLGGVLNRKGEELE